MFKIKKSYLYFSSLLLLISFIFGWSSAAENGQTASGKKIIEIEINGTINPSTTDYIKEAIEKAKAENAEAVLILLDTPGGLLSSTKDIVKLILNSQVPVIVYVYPKGASATSAGVFITLSAHVAAMSPGTSIGAAHPVSIGQKPKNPSDDNSTKDDNSQIKGKEKDIMGEKIENYASSFIESIAEERGRNVKWAEDAVRKSASITASEALKKNVVNIISPSVDILLSDIDGMKIKLNKNEKVLVTKSLSVERLEMSLKQKIVNVLS
ncbi:MAG: NfeD family protein, partial [Thermodesulfobacteriota bacterium]